MGLHLTHNCWSYPYTMFHEWRTVVASAAGIDLDRMEGYDDSDEAISWESLPTDPLHVLLTHSDTDGSIVAKDCLPLADRLDELIPHLPVMCIASEWPDLAEYEIKDPDNPDTARNLTVRFVDGLRLAARKGEDVVFC